MDKFIQEVLEPTEIIINARTLSKNTGEVFVLGDKVDYERNAKLRMLPGIRFIHPNSHEAKLFENDPTILRADDFFKDEPMPILFDYSTARINYLSPNSAIEKAEPIFEPQIQKEPKQNQNLEQQIQSQTADDYNKTDAQNHNFTQNRIPSYTNSNFSSQNSWYSQMPTRGLESVMKYPLSTGNIRIPVSYNYSIKNTSIPYRG